MQDQTSMKSVPMNPRTEELILYLSLTPHPEGGYYRETHRSGIEVQTRDSGIIRKAVTDIYFLLARGQISRFHRVLSDEIWHFYEGDALELLEICPDTLELSRIVLGEKDKAAYKHCIQGGNWQAARSLGEYSLTGCTVAPGFEFADFRMLQEDQAVFKSMIDRYPELAVFV